MCRPSGRDALMSLSSAQYLKDHSDEPLQYNGGPGWQEVSSGLKLVARGYCVLILGSIVALLLIRFALAYDVPSGPSERRDDRNTLLSLGALTVLLTIVFSYGLVLLG